MSLTVTVNGETRQANELEIEMLAAIRTMSAKLLEAADLWEMYVKNFPEPAKDYRCNADFVTYLKQYGINS
jgi:hypothetical protein